MESNEKLEPSNIRMTRQLAKVTTDGRTVWVNKPLCIGRFCKYSGEVFRTPNNMCIEITPPNWKTWKKAMKFHHSINISDKYKPAYA